MCNVLLIILPDNVIASAAWHLFSIVQIISILTWTTTILCRLLKVLNFSLKNTYVLCCPLWCQVSCLNLFLFFCIINIYPNHGIILNLTQEKSSWELLSSSYTLTVFNRKHFNKASQKLIDLLKWTVI